MPKLDLFIPFSKAVEKDGEFIVYGTLTAEEPDRSKEILDYDKSKPYFKAWSESVHKDSHGKSFGNCRYMHQLEIAGHGTDIVFNDEQKRIEICTKISNPKAVQQIKDGELTGYSVGGSYVEAKKIGGLTRYVADPMEYSVVDRPCVPGATFQYFKADGSVELKKFAKYEQEELSADAIADAVVERLNKREFSTAEREKLATEGKALPDGSFPIETVGDLENAIRAIGRASDPAKAKAHIEARAKALDRTDLIPDSWGKSEKTTIYPSVETLTKTLEELQTALKSLGEHEMSELTKAARKSLSENLQKAKEMATAHHTAIQAHLDKCMKAVGVAEGNEQEADAGKTEDQAEPTGAMSANDIGKAVEAALAKAGVATKDTVEKTVVTMLEKMFGPEATTEKNDAGRGQGDDMKKSAVAKNAAATDEDDLPPAPGTQNNALNDPKLRKAVAGMKASNTIPAEVDYALSNLK